MFTVELSNKYTIMYMGHSQGGRNGRGYQEGKELARDKNNLAGLIEFVEYKVSQCPLMITSCTCLCSLEADSISPGRAHPESSFLAHRTPSVILG
jgi:hypothetical protein